MRNAKPVGRWLPIFAALALSNPACGEPQKDLGHTYFKYGSGKNDRLPQDQIWSDCHSFATDNPNKTISRCTDFDRACHVTHSGATTEFINASDTVRYVREGFGTLGAFDTSYGTFRLQAGLNAQMNGFFSGQFWWVSRDAYGENAFAGRVYNIGKGRYLEAWKRFCSGDAPQEG